MSLRERSWTERKTPREIASRSMRANQISTLLSNDDPNWGEVESDMSALRQEFVEFWSYGREII